jgi:YebC/PmpR family DNA-binding regulatory protein
MSGHSKWSSIKHKKAKTDAARGRVFSRLTREISVAAKRGGGDIDTNSRLRTAVQAARDVNMPADNIERAIKKGTGELPGVVYEEIIYEGYGPAGVAIMIEVLTDNKNRTSADIRKIFSKSNGNLGGEGSVSWGFSKKGMVIVDSAGCSEDELMEISLDEGAEDIKQEETNFVIITAPEKFSKLCEALKNKNVAISVSELTQIPSSTVKVEGKQAEQVLKLVEALEEYEDVQNVYANFDIPDEIMEK